MLLASSTTRFVFRRAISLDCLEFNCWLLQSLLELTLNSFFVDCFLNLYIAVAAFINWITIFESLCYCNNFMMDLLVARQWAVDLRWANKALFCFDLLGVKFWNWESAVYDIIFLVTAALWSSSCVKTIVGLCCKNRFISIKAVPAVELNRCVKPLEPLTLVLLTRARKDYCSELMSILVQCCNS